MVSCTGLHADIRKEDTEVKESLGQIAKGGLFLKVFPQYLQTKTMIFPAMPESFVFWLFWNQGRF